MTEHAARIDNLKVHRAGFAIHDLSFALPRGTVLGLVGPNGAGKTTTIRALLGLRAPDAGTVELLGRSAGSPESLARTGVVLDEPTAAPEWAVASLSGRLRPFYPHWDEQRFGELLAHLSIPPGRRVGELSRGQGVKLSLATALAQSPDLLILDEPSSGLDPASRHQIGELLREFMVDPEHSVLFSTHITSDLTGLAATLLILVDGNIAFHGPLDGVAEAFAIARGSGPPPPGPTLGIQRSGSRWSALLRREDSAILGPDVETDAASVDDVVIHLAADASGAAV